MKFRQKNRFKFQTLLTHQKMVSILMLEHKLICFNTKKLRLKFMTSPYLKVCKLEYVSNVVQVDKALLPILWCNTVFIKCAKMYLKTPDLCLLTLTFVKSK